MDVVVGAQSMGALLDEGCLELQSSPGWKETSNRSEMKTYVLIGLKGKQLANTER